jgi:hypothetical protein
MNPRNPGFLVRTQFYSDSQLSLATVAIDTKTDLCIAAGFDPQTHMLYTLFDKPGIE